MAIGNMDRSINANIVNRITKMYVVVSQGQHPFVVACLLNAVSLRDNTCIKIVLECNPFGLTVFFLPPPLRPGVKKAPLHGQTIIRFLVGIVDYV